MLADDATSTRTPAATKIMWLELDEEHDGQGCAIGWLGADAATCAAGRTSPARLNSTLRLRCHCCPQFVVHCCPRISARQASATPRASRRCRCAALRPLRQLFAAACCGYRILLSQNPARESRLGPRPLQHGPCPKRMGPWAERLPSGRRSESW